MAIFGTSNAILTTSTRDTQKNATHLISFSFTGLKANMTHDVYLNGELSNWSVKPFGKNLGDPVTTDDNGRVTIQVLLEFYSSGSYIFDTPEANRNLLAGKKKDNNEASYHITNKLLEIRAPGSMASVNIPMRIMVTSASPGNIEAAAH